MQSAPKMYMFHAVSEQDTVRLANRLAALMKEGTVVALDGDLGAGKTRFSQAIAAELGVAELVNSPTFTIIKEYEGTRLPFYHMDVYRLSVQEADELGLDEYFYGEGVTLVEWASLIGPLMPEHRLEIYIEVTGPEERQFQLVPVGEPYTAWCAELWKEGWFS